MPDSKEDEKKPEGFDLEKLAEARQMVDMLAEKLDEALASYPSGEGDGAEPPMPDGGEMGAKYSKTQKPAPTSTDPKIAALEAQLADLKKQSAYQDKQARENLFSSLVTQGRLKQDERKQFDMAVDSMGLAGSENFFALREPVKVETGKTQAPSINEASKVDEMKATYQVYKKQSYAEKDIERFMSAKYGAHYENVKKQFTGVNGNGAN